MPIVGFVGLLGNLLSVAVLSGQVGLLFVGLFVYLLCFVVVSLLDWWEISSLFQPSETVPQNFLESLPFGRR